MGKEWRTVTMASAARNQCPLLGVLVAIYVVFAVGLAHTAFVAVQGQPTAAAGLAARQHSISAFTKLEQQLAALMQQLLEAQAGIAASSNSTSSQLQQHLAQLEKELAHQMVQPLQQSITPTDALLDRASSLDQRVAELHTLGEEVAVRAAAQPVGARVEDAELHNIGAAQLHLSYFEYPQQQHPSLDQVLASVPFYMYDDPVMRMDDMNACPGWTKPLLTNNDGYVLSDGPELALFSLLEHHPWRVSDPEAAKVFVIPIPVVASKLYYNPKKCGGTHKERTTRAFRRLYAHPVYHSHSASHYLHCQHWSCFLARKWQNDTIPYQLYEEGNLSNIMVGRYERHYTTQSDCDRYGSTFNICRPVNESTAHYPHTGLYHMRWEVSRCAIVVPYLADASLPLLQPSFAEWSKRSNMVLFHTAKRVFAWDATKLRHAPINSSFSSLPGVQVGFGLPRKKWVSELTQSKFCLVMRGDTPTSHSLYNAIKVGCIPVIISGTFSLVGQPFSTQLPWSLFSITLPENEFLEDPVGIGRYLWQLPDKHLQSLLANLKTIAQPALLYERNGTLADHILRQLDIECLD